MSNKILKAHKRVTDMYENLHAQVDHMIDEYRCTYVDEDFSIECYNRNDVKTRIIDAVHNISYAYYLLDNDELIDEYTRILKKPIQVSFMTKTPEKTAEKRELERRIMRNLQPFVRVKNKTPNIKCRGCNSKKFEQVSNNSSVCTDCGIYHEIAQAVNTKESSKYTPNRLIHFKECLYNFLGIDNKVIPAELICEVKEWIRSFDISLDVLRREHILTFIKNSKYRREYVDHTTIIYNKITGRTMFDVTQDTLDNVLHDFSCISNAVNDYQRKDKCVKFPNSHYLMYQLLKKNRIRCSKCDFNMLKTDEKRKSHDDLCEILFRKLNWKFKPVF